MILTTLVSLLALILPTLYLALIYFSHSIPTCSKSEKLYKNSKGDLKPLGEIIDEATYELSVVIPAFNEKERLGIMLSDCVEFLEKIPLDTTQRISGVKQGSYEILIVDDGSTDGTFDIALELAKQIEADHTKELRSMRGQIKVVRLEKNRGKGGCVRHGMLHASGARVLFVDADGASHFPDLALLNKEMDRMERISKTKKFFGIVVGSRAHLVQTEAVVKRSFLRNLLMRLFHTYLFLLGIRTIRDTQCGFKLHSRAAVAHLYPNLHSPSWIFDCELLLRASLAGIPISEVGIKWKEISGSKVNLISDSLAMAVDLLVIRGNFLIGRWEKPSWVGKK